MVVVDDHSLFRRGLVSLLSEIPEFQVVGEASDGREALDVVARTSPDLVLLDINMPVMDGIETVQAMRKERMPVKILMLTISQHSDDLMGAILAGADGYLLKNTEPAELRRSILLVMEGKSVLSPEVTRQVMRAVSQTQQLSSSSPLSEREIEVLHCLANGSTTTQISSQLFISENTVKTHIRHILEKLDAANRTEAVSKAIQMGLIQRNH
jgi:DNA-binding NarL/FixJ family response regulator